MNPILFALALLFVGGLLGQKLAKSRFAWRLGAGFALIAIVATSLARRFDTIAVQLPFLVAGHSEYLIFALFAPVFFLALLPRLRVNQRRSVCLFLGFSLLYYSLLPLVLPLVLRTTHANLETKFDKFGICRQTTSYTCGPASAVTALSWINVSASEAELAVAAHANPVSGTQPDFLCSALNDRLPGEWQARYTTYQTVGDLATQLPALAIIRQTFMADHYVAVLEAIDGTLVIGDPGSGLTLMDYADFAKIWRRQAIVLEQEPTLQSVNSQPRPADSPRS
jgi:predicted double-glycine peptidase